jgi:predicted transcriptional regulator
MAGNRKKVRAADPVVAELDVIKRLLMLQLIDGGMKATEIGRALGISQPTMSRLIPARALKRAKRAD